MLIDTLWPCSCTGLFIWSSAECLPWLSQSAVAFLPSHSSCPWIWRFSCLCSWALVWAQEIFVLGSRQGLHKSGGPLEWFYQDSACMRVWEASEEINSFWKNEGSSHTNISQRQSAGVWGRDNCEYSMVSATQFVLGQVHRDGYLSHVVIHLYSTFNEWLLWVRSKTSEQDRPIPWS